MGAAIEHLGRPNTAALGQRGGVDEVALAVAGGDPGHPGEDGAGGGVVLAVALLVLEQEIREEIAVGRRFARCEGVGHVRTEPVAHQGEHGHGLGGRGRLGVIVLEEIGKSAADQLHGLRLRDVQILRTCEGRVAAAAEDGVLREARAHVVRRPDIAGRHPFEERGQDVLLVVGRRHAQEDAVIDTMHRRGEEEVVVVDAGIDVIVPGRRGADVIEGRRDVRRGAVRIGDTARERLVRVDQGHVGGVVGRHLGHRRPEHLHRCGPDLCTSGEDGVMVSGGRHICACPAVAVIVRVAGKAEIHTSLRRPVEADRRHAHIVELAPVALAERGVLVTRVRAAQEGEDGGHVRPVDRGSVQEEILAHLLDLLGTFVVPGGEDRIRPQKDDDSQQGRERPGVLRHQESHGRHRHEALAAPHEAAAAPDLEAARTAELHRAHPHPEGEEQRGRCMLRRDAEEQADLHEGEGHQERQEEVLVAHDRVAEEPHDRHGRKAHQIGHGLLGRAEIRDGEVGPVGLVDRLVHGVHERHHPGGSLCPMDPEIESAAEQKDQERDVLSARMGGVPAEEHRDHGDPGGEDPDVQRRREHGQEGEKVPERARERQQHQDPARTGRGAAVERHR